MLRSRTHPKGPPRLRSHLSPDDTRHEKSLTARDSRPAIDWKGWIVLAWVLWFGLSYGKMVLAERSEKIAHLVSWLVKSL